MITIFTIPKPFSGHIGVIQRNALCSWLALEPRPEVIVAGNEAGVEDVVREFALGWIPAPDRTALGTPLLDGVFREVAARARYPQVLYCNADIILPPTVAKALAALGDMPDFLAVGRRTDVDLAEPVSGDDFRGGGVLARLEREGVLSSPFAIDYFLFQKSGRRWHLPPFAVGRPGWDNWMIFNAIHDRVPVVELSDCLRILHQNHGYGHVPQGSGPTWEGPEADYNRKLAGSRERLRFSLIDATHRLTADGRIEPVRQCFAARLKRLAAVHPGLKWLIELVGFPWLIRERKRRLRRKRQGYCEP